MLNTFRVIFVDHDGFVIPNPSGCDYNQSSTRGYYSIDHGQPTGIAGNYAYDNRSINDWYRKYGVRNPNIPLGGDSTLFPPNNPLVESFLLAGKTGALMASAGMTSPGKDKDGVGVYLADPAEGDTTNSYIEPAPAFFYMRKNYDNVEVNPPLINDQFAHLNLRTPSYFFAENRFQDTDGNITSIRNINKTKAINFVDTDSPYDLKFDTNPSSPVQDELDNNPQEIDLSEDSNDYPQWIYIGLVGAGGPAGAKVQELNDSTDGFGVCQQDADNNMYNKVGLCDYWFNNRNLSDTPGGIDTVIATNSTYIMSQNYSGLQSAAGQGGRAGIFLRACGAPNNSNDRRNTVVVRLLELGKGGVETFDDSDRVYNETTINKTKTVFPTYEDRKTKVEIYIDSKETGSLDNTDLLLTIEVDGGKAAIMQKVVVSDVPCENLNGTGYRESYCAECSGNFDTGSGVDNKICINRDATLFSNEIYHDDSTTPSPTEDNRAPAYRITLGPYARSNSTHYEIKNAIPFSSCPSGSSNCDTPSIADPIFPEALIEQGIHDQSDWFTAAGGIQESPETEERTMDETDSSYGLGADFIFYGDTEYVLTQNGAKDSPEKVIIPCVRWESPSSGDVWGCMQPDNNRFGQGLEQNPIQPDIKYYKQVFNDDDYDEVDLAEYANINLVETFSIKMVLNFPKNSIQSLPLSGFGFEWLERFVLKSSRPDELTSSIPTGFKSASFAYRRSTDQLLARPGLPGVMKATMVYPGNNLLLGNGASDFAEGVGGNGGAVFVGWGDHVNRAAESFGGGGGGIPTVDPWNDFKLVSGSGFGTSIIQPKAESHTENRLSDDFINQIIYSDGNQATDYDYKQYGANDPFYKRIELGYTGDYGPVGDSTAKGYDVAPIARFTEMPETTREGDFFVTLQAYHMEGIHKVTFIMDGGDPVDVYAPVNHPDTLGTDYDNTASGRGRGYREYMARVDTSSMTHDTAHEIRAIVWPNSGYPLLLQGEKADRTRMRFNATGNNKWGIPEQTNEEKKNYRVSPTIFPWVSNTYPDYMCDFTPQNGTDDTVYTTPPEQDDEGKYFIIKDDPQFQTGLEWKARPGGLIDNFEGQVDDDGNPAWWTDGSLANSVSYHGFWFRHQKSDQRKNVYIDPSYTGTDSDGSREKPYKNVDDFMDDKLIRNQTTNNEEVVDPAFYSARVLLMATNTNGVYDTNSVPQTHKYFSSDNPIAGSEFQNALDNASSRSAAQNPSCQVLTVEADPAWIEHVGAENYWNPEMETSDVNNEIFMTPNDGGWGENNGQDDNGADLKHSSIHFRNLRFISDNPSDDQGSLFQTSNSTNNLDTHYWVEGNEERVKGQTIILDSCRINSYSDLGVCSQFNYLDGNGKQSGGKVAYPGFEKPENSNPDSGVLKYDEVTEVPLDRSELRSVRGPLPVVWEKFTSENNSTKKKINGVRQDVIVFRRIWDGDRFPSDNDIIAPNLRTDILKDPDSDTGYKDYLVNWTPGDPTLDVDGKTPDKFEDGLYKSATVNPVDNTEGIRSWGFVQGNDVFCLKEESEAGEPVWYVDDGSKTADPFTGKLDNVLLQPVGGVNPDTQENTMGPSSIEQYAFDPLGKDPLNGEAEGVPTKRTVLSPGINSGSYGRKMLEGDYTNTDAFCFNSNISSYQAARRFTGVNTVKNVIETNSEGDTTARSTACILNVVTNVRNINMYSGKRVLTNGVNTVHGDLNQFDAGNKHWMDNRMMCDIYMANNSSQLCHLSSEGGTFRRNSVNDYWRSGHRTRNVAMVNIITDTPKTSSTWNYYENTDHVYVRGWRVRQSTFAHRITARPGLPLSGEKYDYRLSHVYFADMQQGAFAWKIKDDAFEKLEPARLLDGIGSTPESHAGWARTNPSVFSWQTNNKNSYPFAWDTSQENGSGTYKPTEWDEANDLKWIPVYTKPSDDNVNTDISLDPPMVPANYNDSNDFDDELRKSMRNCVIMENSNFNFGSHVFMGFGSGGSKVTERPAMKSMNFGEGTIPSMDEAYLPNPNTPSGEADFGALGPPKGIPAPNGRYFDADENRDIKCIPTIVGTPEEIETLYQGFSGPVNFSKYTWVDDDGNWVAPSWTSNGFDQVESRYTTLGNGLKGGDPIQFWYPYSMHTFLDVIRDGGWNYTGHWPDDYTPHKL